MLSDRNEDMWRGPHAGLKTESVESAAFSLSTGCSANIGVSSGNTHYKKSSLPLFSCRQQAEKVRDEVRPGTNCQRPPGGVCYNFT